MRIARIAIAIIVAAVPALAQTPSPALLVLNKGANELAIVDPTAMKVLGRVPVGEGPHEVATDGKLAFVANFGGRTPGHTLSVIDLATQKEIKRVDLGSLQRPHGILVNGGKVWFTAEDTANRGVNPSATGAAAGQQQAIGVIASYDPASQQVASTSTGQYATHMLVITKDGKKIFTSNIASNNVSVGKPGTPGTTTIPVGKGPEAIDLSPDGREVWVAHSQDGGISIIDVKTEKVTQTLDIGTKRSNRLKFTPDGKRVLVSDINGDEVVVLDAKTRKEIKRIHTGGHPEGIQMVPDGSRAFVALAQDGVIATIDLKTLEVTNKLPTGPDADGMAWVK